MAINVGNKHAGAIAEINVTPMADVMIVLLIIFMVLVPILPKIDAKLPPAANASARNGDTQIVVALERTQVLRLDGIALAGPEVLAGALRSKLAERSERNRTVLLKAHEALSFDLVARTLDACRGAGAEEIAFVTDRKI